MLIMQIPLFKIDQKERVKYVTYEKIVLTALTNINHSLQNCNFFSVLI